MKGRAQIKINGKLCDVEIENGEITIIEPKTRETGWERLEDRSEKYFYNSGCGETYDTENNITGFDAEVYKKANYFSDEKLAQNISRMQTLQRQMFRWQAENDDTFDESMIRKYYISFDENLKIIGIRYSTFSSHGFLPYFTSKEKAEECIKEFYNELMWLFTEFQWRMDGGKYEV